MRMADILPSQDAPQDERLVPRDILRSVIERVKKSGVPEISMPKEPPQTVELPDLQILPNEELERLLSFFGGYRSYLESQLADAEIRRDILEESFEQGVGREIFILARSKYKDQKRPGKDILWAEAVNSDKLLFRSRQKLLEANVICKKLFGLKEAYKSYYETVSRVVALRLQSKDRL